MGGSPAVSPYLSTQDNGFYENVSELLNSGPSTLCPCVQLGGGRKAANVCAAVSNATKTFIFSVQSYMEDIGSDPY